MAYKALVTGGSGFFGGILKRHLLDLGWDVINVDLVKDDDAHPRLTSHQGDIRDRALLEKAAKDKHVDAVFHCAAILAHAVKDNDFLWGSNVDGTRTIAEFAKVHGIKKLVFTSSNCLWGKSFGRPVREDDEPCPVEIYGRSKWEGEKVLAEFGNSIDITIIRCPTIIEAGRLGLLAILFEFIDEHRKVWTVGGGGNRYQFIYAGDLANACVKAVERPHPPAPSPLRGGGGGLRILHIGSDNVPTVREAYEHVIRKAGSRSRVASLPKAPAIAAMKVLYALGLSPLGPYHYKMIAEDFVFDTSKIKRELQWQPTLTNGEMLWRAYQFYRANRESLRTGEAVSAHRQPARMGAIKLLKWIS